MFNNIKDATAFLESRRNSKLSLDPLKEAFNKIGNPQNKLKSIHIGGTNGKGSTTNFVRSILQEEGFKVGTFTSPYLVVHNDRIRINDVNISDEDLLKYINDTEDLWQEFNLSMFEIDMLISVLYFVDQNVDYVVFEVGLGGRLDATNVITPMISAITNVDYDHMNILGNDLKSITNEKMGIVKDGVPFITSEAKKEVLDYMKEKREDFIQIKTYPIKIIEKGFILEYEDGIRLFKQGLYQAKNASLAINIINELDLGIKFETIKNGIEKTHWKGRFEEVIDNVYVDGAHNNQGMTSLIESLEILPKPHTVIFSALGDKEHHEMLMKLEKEVDELIITEFDFYRAASAEELAEGINAKVIKDYEEAIDYGIKENKGTLIITGSLYFISDVRKYILEKYE